MILLSTSTLTIKQICHTCECIQGRIHPSLAQDIILTKHHGHHRLQYTHGEACVHMPQSPPCRQDYLKQHNKVISLDALQLITMNSLSSFKK